MLDEMALKKQIEHVGNKSWGYVDIGTNIQDDELVPAANVLVLMVVCVNGNWKLPIAYFFITSLSGKEKANIVKEALVLVHEVEVTVVAITCDRPAAHFTMAKELGADIDGISDIKPYFSHPVSDNKVFIIFDACHMLKLVRNNWAKLKVLVDGDGQEIDFQFINKLYKVQETESLRFATKLGRAHIDWERQKMKVSK